MTTVTVTKPDTTTATGVVPPTETSSGIVETITSTFSQKVTTTTAKRPATISVTINIDNC